MSMTPGSKIIMAEYDMTTIQIGPINMWQVNVTRGICPYIVCCYFEPWSIYQKVGKILYNWFTFTLICQEDFEKEEKIPKKKYCLLKFELKTSFLENKTEITLFLE